MNRQLVFCVLPVLVAAAHSQTPQTILLPPDSPRLDLQADAKVTDYLRREAIYFNGGAAVVKDLEMRDGVIDVKLDISYSDDVSVFLNGKILFRGRSSQNFRDPDFLGIVNIEDDAVYLPLKKSRNDLILADSELDGGWGFICHLEDMAN